MRIKSIIASVTICGLLAIPRIAADDAAKNQLQQVLAEKTSEILKGINTLQSHNGWDCGCADTNLAGIARGIEDDHLRELTWANMARYFLQRETMACEAQTHGFLKDNVFSIYNLYLM